MNLAFVLILRWLCAHTKQNGSPHNIFDAYDDNGKRSLPMGEVRIRIAVVEDAVVLTEIGNVAFQVDAEFKRPGKEVRYNPGQIAEELTQENAITLIAEV